MRKEESPKELVESESTGEGDIKSQSWESPLIVGKSEGGAQAPIMRLLSFVR